MKLLFLIFAAVSLSAEDSMFKFSEQYVPAQMQTEKKRKICFFPFRNKGVSSGLRYLQEGIPSVLFSHFHIVHFVFDRSPLAESVIYESGPRQKKKEDESERLSAEILEEYNEEKKIPAPEKDPRYIRLEKEMIRETFPPFAESAQEEGKKRGCFYIVTGEFETAGEDVLKVQAELTERKNGKTETVSSTVSVKRGLQEMEKISSQLKSKLLAEGAVTIQVDSGIPDAFVYLDGEYAGKTPLERNDIHPGRHRLKITKEGYVTLYKLISPAKNRISSYSFPLVKSEKKAKISVSSDPEGASAYLGTQFLGDTPVKDAEIPVGPNRLRLMKENYIDHFQGIDAKDGSDTRLNVKMKPGDTEKYYKNRLNIFLDYNYFDFALYSLYSSILFYGTYMYAGYRIDLERDKFYSNTNYFNVILAQSSQGGTSSVFSLNQNQQLALYFLQKRTTDSIGRSTAYYNNFQSVGVAGAASMLVLSGVFYYMGISSDAFEFGFKPDFRKNEASAEMELKFRF